MSTAPALRSLDLPLDGAWPSPGIPREGVEVFVVTGEGSHGAIAFAVGDLLVCRGAARPGETTVLVARGHGRPRLGTVEGTRFRGDAGEPCHPDRWRSAGALVARYRRGPDGWVIELLHRKAIDRGSPVAALPAIVEVAPTPIEAAAARRDAATGGAAAGGRGGLPAAQLPLFAA
ncbi:MAG: hypothetical protein R3F59_35665 [Myxococcota bacterium]